MDRKISKVNFEPKRQINVLRVAAYARVSTGKDSMLHSLSAQVSYYSDMIQKHPGWLYCGVYADEALTGTKESRKNFQRLLADCRAGKIDLVITKSISRFARNTVTLLATIRELKDLGVDVFFEEQNIHTISTDGELMITILASYAQEESRSASENQKWRIKKCFEAGIPYDPTLLGYRIRDGKYVIEPEEAKTVRRIYEEYLSGKGIQTIANELNHDGIVTRFGMEWHTSGVQRILRNITYTGNLLLQKTFRENHITKRKIMNTGELPKYAVTDKLHNDLRQKLCILQLLSLYPATEINTPGNRKAGAIVPMDHDAADVIHADHRTQGANGRGLNIIHANELNAGSEGILFP